MLKSIIIEDQAPAQFILEKYIANTEGLNLERTFSDALEARQFLEAHPVDLVFLDINLPLISGMEFLRSAVNQPLTILTTAYSEFALECYRYNVVDYLLKPFSFERFSQAIDKVSMMSRSVKQLGSAADLTMDKHVYIRCSHELMKVKSEEIIFITSDSDYTEVVTTSQKYLTLDSLRDWTVKLSGEFVQVHKSFIVNTNHLFKISHNKVYLSREHVIPIGRVFKKGFMESVEKNI